MPLRSNDLPKVEFGPGMTPEYELLGCISNCIDRWIFIKKIEKDDLVSILFFISRFIFQDKEEAIKVMREKMEIIINE